MSGPRCAMWQGRCGNQAAWRVTVHVPTGERHAQLTWLTCDDGACRQMSHMHTKAFKLRHFASRRLTPAELTTEAVAA